MQAVHGVHSVQERLEGSTYVNMWNTFKSGGEWPSQDHVGLPDTDWHTGDG